MKKSTEDRFWEKIQKTDTCWLWRASTVTGYGVFRAEGKTILAHHYSWRLLGRDIPKGRHLSCSCSHIDCVNPEHWYLENAETAANRFWSKVKKTENCWLWTGAPAKDGYGEIWVVDRRVRVHRYVWEITFGPIPQGLDVLHHCDNPPCVRPEHLFLGTVQNNMEDKCVKGRQSRGETQGLSKLTEDQIVEIRDLREHGRLLRELSEQFGVTMATISHICRRDTWKHLK